MKLLRHGPKGHEKPGLLDDEGQVRDLSALMPDITPAMLSPSALAELRSVDVRSLPLVPQGLRNASFALGASHAQTVLKVTVPAALPAIVTAICLVSGSRNDVR